MKPKLLERVLYLCFLPFPHHPSIDKDLSSALSREGKI